MSSELILSHVGTDFDGFACMALAAKLYPNASMVFPGRLSSGVAEFYNLHRRHFPILALKEALKVDPKRIILVDTRLASRVGPFRAYLHRNDIELHIYDHHPPSTESIKGDQEWISAVGAAVTLLIERCQKANLKLTTQEATLSLIAIHEETGSFRYAATTARDLKAASFLIDEGANMEVLDHFLRDPLTASQRALLEEFLASGCVIKGPSGTLYLAGAHRKKPIFGLGLLASRLLEVQGTDAVCLGLRAGKQSSLATRASSDVFDLAAWMQRWGGGGHRRAAAASKIEADIPEIFEELRQLVLSSGTATLFAKDLMSADVFSLPQDHSIAEASVALRRAGFPSACIVNEAGGLVGLVARDDLEKALHHNLGHAPATSVMTHKVVSVEPTAPVSEVRRIVVERGVGTIPVISNDKIIGIISRSDLLRDLYQEATAASWSEKLGSDEVNLSTTAYPCRLWLEIAQQLAEERHLHIYVVGGFVRDTLLGRATEDLDLVVEGDACELACSLAHHFKAKVVKHDKYLTASVLFPDGGKLDIATARRETYVRPAALPEVSQSSLKADLYRRDFSINSLAIRLASNLRGSVIDFFGGLQDLEAGVVRVLHNHSFFDDPSRIIRAIRFEQRLGFNIEPSTRQLIEAALEANAFSMTNPNRLKKELRLALAESDPIRVLSRCEELRILEFIHPELVFNGKVKQRTERALQIVTRFPDLLPDSDFWQVPLFLFGLSMASDQALELQERYEWRMLQWPWDPVATVGLLCRRHLTPSKCARLLDLLTPVALVVFCTISTHTTFVARTELYLAKLRGETCPVSGSEIIALGVAPGPEVTRWKEATLDALRDGEFSERSEALAWLQAKLASA